MPESNDLFQLYEGMTSISALLETEEAGQRINDVLVDKTKKRSKAREIAFLEAKAKELGFSLCFVEPAEIDALASGKTHGGILARCKARELAPLTRKDILPGGFYAYLDGIEDPYNFGYTLRSLYAAGASGVVLTERNWMNASGVVAKASAGTSEKLPLFVSEIGNAVDLFKEIGRAHV